MLNKWIVIHHVYNCLHIICSVFSICARYSCALACLKFCTCFKFRGASMEFSKTISQYTFLGCSFLTLSTIFHFVDSEVFTYSLQLPFLLFLCMLTVEGNVPTYSTTAFPVQVMSIPLATFSIQATLFLQSGLRFRQVQNRLITITSSSSGCGSNGTQSASRLVQ